MPLYGNIVVIKRNGTDGIIFPLTASSCLFGRRTECDIRIQLPQVSKEHCKIEVNENKEAILTNLSTVNPTQLNGSSFQEPVPLKHGDVLTVIDRSFRFEYPLQSTPRKRRSRTAKDETPQQVAEEELLRKQTPGSKSLHASDNAECEEKNGNENKQSTEENISKALPIKPQTPKSSNRMHQSCKKQNQMSPFSKLYEKLKHEIKAKKHLHEGNVSQQAAKEDSRSVLEPSARFSSSGCDYDLGSVTKEYKMRGSENIEECKITQKVINSEFNHISAVGSATKKSCTRSPQTSVSKEESGDTGKSHLQDDKGLSRADKSKGSEATARPREENNASVAFSLKHCPIESLDYTDKMKIYGSAVVLDKLVPTTYTMNVSEVEKYVLSTPTPRRKSPRSHFTSPAKETSGMNLVNTDTPIIQRRASLEHKSFSEILAETQREDSVCRNDSLKQLPLAENKCLKQRRNSKQHTTRKPVKEVLPEEICDQENFINTKGGHCETPGSSDYSSPRRNIRQNKELSNRSVNSETLTSEELALELASPAGQVSDSGRKKGRPRTSGQLTEKALNSNVVQEHHNKTTDRKDSGTEEELATKGNHQKLDVEDASVTRSRRLSSKRRSSGSATVLQDNESVSEMNVSSLLAREESGKTKRISQKRKSSDLLLQPLGKRKRVSFGGQLSPELFDKSLPPNSPLKKGATPARLNLPFGNSPRAVLKKAQGLKPLVVKEVSEHLQKEKRSPKNLPSQKSPVASSPASEKTTCRFTLGSPAPYTKGRFSVSRIMTPLPIAEEKDAVAEDVNTKDKNDTHVKTPPSYCINQDDKTFLMATPDKLRGTQPALKVTSMKRRSGAVAVINAKRRSGASSANLLVAKSWAEVVKSGVARPQSKTVKKSVRKGRSLRKITRSPKTPERKIKGHFSTGHAESPATIVVGRAYSTTVRTAGHVPKVVKNTLLKLDMNMDESFTGMTEMFQTPEIQSREALPLATVQKTDFTPTCTAVDISELHTPEESGEMMVSPLNSSDASEQKQDNPGICYFLRDKESLTSIFDAISTKTPEERKDMLEENITVDNLSVIPEKEVSLVKSVNKRRTAKHKLESIEVMAGVKRLLRTPKQSPEPVEALSGIKELMKTPKQKSELVEDFSGIKHLLRTPQQKPEPVEVLSGIKGLMRTPKQKPEPTEVLSDIKRLMRTPKQKPEPAEVLSGIKQLMRTPKQKPEPVEVLSGIKRLTRTPKQKPEPAEVMSGIKRLMRTPKQKPEPVEVLSGIKRLMRTPKQKPEPVEVLSGIKQLMSTPQQELEPVTDEIAFESLLKTPVRKREAVKDVASVAIIKKAPKRKYPPVEDMIGVSRIFKTPKEKVEPIEDIFGISRLMKMPREKNQPVDDFVGLQRLMAEPRQKHSNSEMDYVGVKEMFDTPQEIKVRSINVVDSKQEDTAPSCNNSSHKCEDKGDISQGQDTEEKESTSDDQSNQRPTRGRPQKRVPSASAKPREKDLNLKELQCLEKKSTQEEMGEASTSTSVTKTRGSGRRTKRCVQEEIVSKHPDLVKVEGVSFVEPDGATLRSRRGKRKELKELKHPSENLEYCSKDSSGLQKTPANMKQTLQEYGINDILETEGGSKLKTVSVSSSIQNQNCQLQTGLKEAENKSNEGGVEDSEEMLLLPVKRSRRVKKVENIEPLIPPKRGRRARNCQVKQDSLEDLYETEKLQKGPSAKMMQRGEQTFGKDNETATTEESEKGTKLEIKITEKRVKSLRSARKHSTEINADICGVALENLENIPNTKEISAETNTETQSHIKEQIKLSQGDESENAQENTTQESQRLKAESSGVTNKMLVTALNLDSNRSEIQETKITRNRRGKKDSLEKKTDEFAEDVNNIELIASKLKSKTKMDESSLKDSLSSVCVKSTYEVVKDQNNPAGTSILTANSDGLAHSCQKRTRNEQEIRKPKQTEIVQENQAQNRMLCTRGKKVTSVLEEATSKLAGGKRTLPGTDKGMTYKDGQYETSENPPSQVRRRRRKQVDSMPQIACSALMEKQTLIADHRKDKAFVKEQDTTLEATPSSTEDNPLRRGKRREVAAASQTSRSLSIRKRHGLLEGGDEKMTVREDQNPALGNKTSQAKANASARDRRKKIDLAAEAESSSSLQRKCGLSETDDKEETTNEEQNMPLETVSCVKGKPLGRGRTRETAQVSHTTNCISLRGKRRLPTDNSGEEAPKEEQSSPLEVCDSSVKENRLRKDRRKETALASHTTNCVSLRGKRLPVDNSSEEDPKEDQNVPLQTCDSSVKENRLRKGRRKEAVLLLEATSSIQGKEALSKESDQKNNYGEAKKLILENSASQEKNDISKGNSKQTVSSLAVSSTSLQDLPEDGKNETPKEQQSILLEEALPAKEIPSRMGRKKTVSSKSEETSSTFLRKKCGLSQDKDQKRILKEHEDTSLENNSSQEKMRQLRNKKKKVEFTSEAATSICKNGDLPENDNTLETQNVCLTSSDSEKNNQTGKRKEVNPVQQAACTSRRRKCQFPADDLASKKLKSENDDSRSLPKGKRNKSKELGEEDVRATRTAGGMDVKTRSSTRTSARTRK